MLFFSIQHLAIAHAIIEMPTTTVEVLNDDPAEKLIELLSTKITLSEEQKEEIRAIALTYQFEGPSTVDYRERIRQFKRHVRNKVLTPAQVAQFKA